MPLNWKNPLNFADYVFIPISYLKKKKRISHLMRLLWGWWCLRVWPIVDGGYSVHPPAQEVEQSTASGAFSPADETKMDNTVSHKGRNKSHGGEDRVPWRGSAGVHRLDRESIFWDKSSVTSWEQGGRPILRTSWAKALRQEGSWVSEQQFQTTD